MAPNNSSSSSGGFSSGGSGHNSSWDKFIRSDYTESHDEDWGTDMILRGLEEAQKEWNALHITYPLPRPYPEYPKLVDRNIPSGVKLLIKDRYHLDSAILSPPSLYNIEVSSGEKIGKVNPRPKRIREHLSFIQALEHFLYLHQKMHDAPLLNLTPVRRCARGAMIRNRAEDVELIEGLEGETVDQILESALQQGDFKAIRSVLNYEGYGIPAEEPNDLQVPPDLGEFDVEELEIEITAEEYQEWEAPLEEIPSNQSATQTSDLQKLFATTMTNNAHLHLERAIRERDIEMLRMLLRLYGHDIAADQPNTPSEDNDSSMDM